MNNRKRNLLKGIGPGTITILVGILTFGAYNLFFPPSPAEPQILRADPSGRLAHAERSPNQVPPLWKPEPELLRSYQGELGLTAAQVARIEEIATAWAKSKADLEGQVENATKFVAKGTSSRVSVATAQTDLGDYSEISREYGRRRESAWASALAVLDSRQRRLFAQKGAPQGGSK